jgi:enoyl-CoA hydratase/carnithine racemase
MTPFLQYEQNGPIVTLTMNAPETRNALTGNNAPQEFVDACARITEDLSVRVVVLTGAGPVFSSGGNLKHMQELFEASPAALRQWYRQGIQKLATAFYNLEVPTIAAVNGAAIGAGCDLTCMCDIRIAADTASFAESFVRVGLIPGDGGAWLLPRVVGMSKASEMSFTGEGCAAPPCRSASRAPRPSRRSCAATARRAAHGPAVRSCPAPAGASRCGRRCWPRRSSTSSPCT